MNVDARDEIRFENGDFARAGPAFVTRAVQGDNWSGKPKHLRPLVNPEAIARLVVFDTWTLNCDRYPPLGLRRKPRYDNVFICTEPPDAPRLIAMDFNYCFTSGRNLTPGVATIERVKDKRAYGYFPAFQEYVRPENIASAVTHLRRLSRNIVQSMVDTIPQEWDVSAGTRTSLTNLIYERSCFVANTIPRTLAVDCGPQGLLEFKHTGDE